MQFLSLSLVVLLPAIVLAGLCDVSPSPSYLSKRANQYESQRNFSIQLLNEIRKSRPNENVFFSPYSTYHALLLAYFGSSGNTESELSRALLLGWADSKEMVRGAYVFEKKERETRANNMVLNFTSADCIFVSNHLPLTQCIENRMFSQVTKMDFWYEPKQSRNRINAWIAEVTHNQIKDMLSEIDITKSTLMALVNAAYFKGEWVSQFRPKKTSLKPFYTTQHRYSFVPMMQQSGSFMLNVNDHLGAHVLWLPYRTSSNSDTQSDISMVLILPSFNDNSLDNLMQRLNARTLDEALSNAMPRLVDVSLPKFELEQKLALVPFLKNMGITKMFNQNTATFDDLTTAHISFEEALHVAKIKVDEKGSTAAAATALISSRSARPAEPFKFECNHPFVFLIYDQKIKTILFAGIYRNPSSLVQ
ncbi:hypothetical protein KR009_011681 [Drosophila setifemur]|nr:hypothetical protein KR009_011681 [Drosophila setifemur]